MVNICGSDINLAVVDDAYEGRCTMFLDYADLVLDNADEALELGAQRAQNAKLKRALDVVGAIAGLMLLAPVLLLIAIAIRIEGPGPALFRQTRSGLNGVPFKICKFRTMRCIEDGATIVQATTDDCRVTRVGALLRRTSLDELPNLINILKGEMSLVGPRPHALAHDNYYRTLIPTYGTRYMTKPGLTGLAQVEGYRGGTSDISLMAARVDRDIEYIRCWSIALDIQLLIRTLLIGPFHPAAY
jgi:lipopolysaccharide/colanic/teichoic acid biosynthesis glycosyltransferase